MKGIKQYLETLEQSGISKTKARGMLNDDDKAALEEHEFIEAQKERYGKNQRK